MQRTKHQSPHQPKKHRFLKVILLLVVIVGIGAGAYAAKIYLAANSAMSNSFRGNNDKNADKRIKDKDNLSILILGVDTGEEGRIDRGNSDTMIVAALNPNQKQMQMVSIPRDTAAQIIGYKGFKMAKINAAYNLGGSEMAKKTVAELLNIPINYYVTLDMKGLEKVVDSVGGVDVEVPFTFTSEATGGQTFNKGKRHLNGNMALAYARMRHEDPEGDYGRQKRQQQVIKAILKKAMSFDGFQHFSELLNSLSNSMTTDINFNNMVGLFNNYRDAADKVASDSLKGQTAWVQTPDYNFPLSFQIISNNELQRVSDKLRKVLNLASEPVNNAETKENALNPNFRFGVDYDQDFIIKKIND